MGREEACLTVTVSVHLGCHEWEFKSSISSLNVGAIYFSFLFPHVSQGRDVNIIVTKSPSGGSLEVNCTASGQGRHYKGTLCPLT